MPAVGDAKYKPGLAHGARIRGRQFIGKWLSGNRWRTMCDKASPTLSVMLHVRSRYVSKAAILSLPGHFVPVEKSKFHLNSKGLNRLAPHCGDGFYPCEFDS
jgi:hypothetical protein